MENYSEEQFVIIQDGTIYRASENGWFMGTNFLSELENIPTLKTFVSNSSRLQNGSRVIVENPKVDKREVSLTFVCIKTTKTARANKAVLEGILLKGSLSLYIPDSVITYNLIYTGPTSSYQFSSSQNVIKMTCKFIEQNPNDRGTEVLS